MKPVPGAAKAGSAAPKPTKAPAAVLDSTAKEAPGASAPAMGSILGSAVSELNAQHPIPHYDHGPHHGTTHHIRHRR